MFNKKWCASILVALILALTVASVAYALHATIVTSDGAVDTNWGVTSVFSNDGDDFSNDNYDIDQAWIINAADNSEFYFRVNLVGSGRLPLDYSSFEARLDCNRDGDFSDGGDVVVYYAPYNTTDSTEEVVECQGNDYVMCDMLASNYSDTNADTFAEEIAASSYNYEWKADVTHGDTNWSQCLGNINVQFASLDQYQQLRDITAWREYNVPTVVTLESFTTHQGYGAKLLSWGVLSIVILLVCLRFIGRFVRRPASG